MGYERSVARSKFFRELPADKQEEYFAVTRAKYLPHIDNIYYNIFLRDDVNGNERLIELFKELECTLNNFLKTHNEVEFQSDLFIKSRGYKMYKYCLSKEGEYDIYIADSLINDQTPRIHIQLRSYGLWVNGIHQMLQKSFWVVQELFDKYNCAVESCRENRIDYCYHTNNIQKHGTIFTKEYFTRHLHTTFDGGTEHWRIEKNNVNFDMITNYVSMGERKSNNIFTRFYDKTREVVEMGYKGMFISIWRKHGLISAYDEYCLHYAYEHKCYNARHKARLLFYMAHGIDEAAKERIQKVLDDRNVIAYRYRDCAKAEGLPEVTIVTNIEFQTMRKFYYTSDRLIEGHLEHLESPGSPDELHRLFKIIDNRALFINYLTEKTVCFVKEKLKNKEPGEKEICCDWWERLRNTKLEGIKPDRNLLREYAADFDKRSVEHHTVGRVAKDASNDDDIRTDFHDDITDNLTYLNDNHVKNMKTNI